MLCLSVRATYKEDRSGPADDRLYLRLPDGREIVLTILRLMPEVNGVRLGVEAPRDVTIERKIVRDRRLREEAIHE